MFTHEYQLRKGVDQQRLPSGKPMMSAIPTQIVRVHTIEGFLVVVKGVRARQSKSLHEYFQIAKHAMFFRAKGVQVRRRKVGLQAEWILPKCHSGVRIQEPVSHPSAGFSGPSQNVVLNYRDPPS